MTIPSEAVEAVARARAEDIARWSLGKPIDAQQLAREVEEAWRLYIPSAEFFIRAHMAWLSSQGMRIVPLEPLMQMIDKGEDALLDHEDSTTDSYGTYSYITPGAARSIYRAMVNAAPGSPPIPRDTASTDSSVEAL